MTIIELRNKRAQKLEAAKAFLESNRTSDGFLSPDDDAAYTRMENEITALGNEIARMERLEAMDDQLKKPVSTPITEKPESVKTETKTGRKSDAYKAAFWNATRHKDRVTPEMKNALQVGSDTEGGYLVPDEFERTLIQGLNENTIVRSLAHVFSTSSGLHKIPVVASHGSAAWIDEEGAYTENDEVFSQVQIDAHKVGTIIKVSEELLNDSAFDLESYIRSEFIRRIGDKEEEAFFTGNGTGKPTGILNATGGGEVGVTAASATAITADELIDLFYSLKAPYRNDPRQTVLYVRFRARDRCRRKDHRVRRFVLLLDRRPAGHFLQAAQRTVREQRPGRLPRVETVGRQDGAAGSDQDPAAEGVLTNLKGGGVDGISARKGEGEPDPYAFGG